MTNGLGGGYEWNCLSVVDRASTATEDSPLMRVTPGIWDLGRSCEKRNEWNRTGIDRNIRRVRGRKKLC